MHPHVSALALLALILGGCSSASVIGPPRPGASERIGRYAIPKALVQATIEFEYEEKANSASDLLTIGSMSMTVTAFDLVLIPAAHIDLHYDPDVFSTDKVTVELDADGFLDQVAVDADDQAGQFITKLADLAIGVGKATAAFPATTFTITNGRVKQVSTYLLDPYEKSATIDPLPGQKGDNVTITTESVGIAEAHASRRGEKKIIDTCGNAICYPALVTRKFTFMNDVGNRAEKLVVVPDPGNLIKLDLQRASFVKKSVTADFSKGIMSKVVVDKPSEALALVQVPLDIVDSIIKLPTELIQLKIDTSEKQTAVLNEQKELIEAQEALLEAVEKARESAAKRADDGKGTF